MEKTAIEKAKGKRNLSQSTEGAPTGNHGEAPSGGTASATKVDQNMKHAEEESGESLYNNTRNYTPDRNRKNLEKRGWGKARKVSTEDQTLLKPQR